MNPIAITIVDKSTLSLISDYIRDGEYSDDDLRIDQRRKTVTLTVWKADYELSTFERAGLVGGWRVSPMRRLVLKINRVQRVDFTKHSPGKGNHPLEGVHWRKRGVVHIDTYDGITIELEVNDLEGELEVTDEVDHSRIQRSRSLGIGRSRGGPSAAG
jgi:hypothetical protein